MLLADVINHAVETARPAIEAAGHELTISIPTRPKTFVYLAAWGFGHATLNGKPLYDNYEIHFMITQGIRDRKTLRVNYPMANKEQPAGEVNPATQQIDFYIRSPQQNPKNKPNREVFMHFFGMEVTWK